ncbi:hypothetical protein RFI_09045 [Reticulomyxa filosa]|uniref:Uncharacterized protein n=1 Tax=Reticulomyxa filosa TaxID=46433 RepID=X6NP78_RETFI|nr:hypothetical protein RFI_09045 [Reticulomyxa filosa]|eukprot:ETO28085.1 hypothetical protein RFI_09045 [Reticulomyxa filosa]
MSASPNRPGRLVEYFITVGLPNLETLEAYHGDSTRENWEEMGLNEIRAIDNIKIIASNKPADIPENYYCVSQSLEGHFVGFESDTWLGKFGKGKNNGPFIAFERSSQFSEADLKKEEEAAASQENMHKTNTLYPITKICIRDVNEYIKNMSDNNAASTQTP